MRFGRRRRRNPTHKDLAERSQIYYDAGFDGVKREDISYNDGVVFRCPWHTEETCNYYRNHPWVSFNEAVKEKPFTWRDAIKERGSEEKMVEFVKYYNEKNGIES